MLDQDNGYRAQQREHPDPHERNRPVPRTVLALVALLLAWAAGYIALTQRNDPPGLGDRRTLATLQGQAKPAGGAIDGAQIYAANCVACHQANGAGLAGVFPPLADSEWVTGKDSVLADILLHGVTGKLTVRGTAYQGVMPAFKDKLNDAELAALLSHVRTGFGNQAGPVSASVVAQAREAGKDRTAPWNGDDELGPRK